MSGIEMDFAAARKAMVVSQLRPQGVTDARVLAAMGRVAREDFVPEAAKAMAYMDRSLTVEGAPMMPPAELGRLLTEIAPQPGEKALVIGPGGAYSTAVLEAIGCSVARAAGLGGIKGAYDILLIEGAVPGLPDALAANLTDDGRIGAAILDRGVARLSIGRGVGHGKGRGIGLRSVVDAQVPPLPGSIPEPAFTF